MMTVAEESDPPQTSNPRERRATPSPARSTKSTKSSNPHSPKVDQQPGDGDVRERPVRKKFEKTSIAGPDELAKLGDQDAEDTTEHTVDDAINTQKEDETTQERDGRGRVRRKRSFEELGEAQEDTRGDSISKHRKRSPDVVGDEVEAENRRVSAESTDSGYKESLSDYELVDKPDATEAVTINRPTTPPNSSRDTANGLLEAQLSPQNKRSRDQFVESQEEYFPRISQDEEPVSMAETAQKSRPSSIIQTQEEEERKSKRHRDSPPRPKEDDTAQPTKATLPNGFANASEKSPFGAIAGGSSIFGSAAPKSPPKSTSETSPSAFAASGFASLSGSTTSPFGSLGDPKANTETSKDAKPLSSFSSGDSSSLSGAAQPSAFASQSGFGKLGSGFSSGGFGSAFGSSSTSAFGTASRTPLKSFASGTGSFGASAISKPSKTFGAVADDEDEEEGEAEDDETGESNANGDQTEEQDERFYEQDIETGEENEVSVFTSRAKLYVSSEKQWKERGVGVFKLNATNIPDDLEDDSTTTTDRKPSARFIMRADGSHRVVLNSPLRKDTKIEDPSGGRPKGRTAVFFGFIEGKVAMLQIKMRGVQQTEELHDAVISLQKHL